MESCIVDSNIDKPTIAVLGGTGQLGRGLVKRWRALGYDVVVGTRTPSDKKVSELTAYLGETVTVLENEKAAEVAQLVVLTVPFKHQMGILEEVSSQLKGKVLIDTTVPLIPPKVSTVQIPEEGSACVRAQKLLGEDTYVVSAFQNIAADLLQGDGTIECDVFVCSDYKKEAEMVVDLIKAMGMNAWYAGVLKNSIVSEALTSVLIRLNQVYKLDHAGIKVISNTLK